MLWRTAHTFERENKTKQDKEVTTVSQGGTKTWTGGAREIISSVDFSHFWGADSLETNVSAGALFYLISPLTHCHGHQIDYLHKNNWTNDRNSGLSSSFWSNGSLLGPSGPPDEKDLYKHRKLLKRIMWRESVSRCVSHTEEAITKHDIFYFPITFLQSCTHNAFFLLFPLFFFNTQPMLRRLSVQHQSLLEVYMFVCFFHYIPQSSLWLMLVRPSLVGGWGWGCRWVGEGPWQPAPICKFFAAIARRHIHHIQPLAHKDTRQDPGTVDWLWRLKGGRSHGNKINKNLVSRCSVRFWKKQTLRKRRRERLPNNPTQRFNLCLGEFGLKANRFV